MGEFKYWKVGKQRVYIVERFGTTTLVEYVTTGVQASVNTSMVIRCTAKPYQKKNPKKEAPASQTVKKQNNNNTQTSLDL